MAGAKYAINEVVEFANSVFTFLGAIESRVLSDICWFATGVMEFLMYVRCLYVYVFNMHVRRGCEGKQESYCGFVGHISCGFYRIEVHMRDHFVASV